MADSSAIDDGEAHGPCSPDLPFWEGNPVASGFYAKTSSSPSTPCSSPSTAYVEDIEPRFLVDERTDFVDHLPDMAANNNSNMFPNFLDNSSNTSSSFSALPRQAPSPSPQQQANQVNGNGVGGMNVAVPMHAGQQMDMNYLYNLVCEYSEILKHNREQTAAIVKAAEEVMVSQI